MVKYECTVDVADWSSGALSIEVSKRFIYVVEGAKWNSKVFELYSIYVVSLWWEISYLVLSLNIFLVDRVARFVNSKSNEW